MSAIRNISNRRAHARSAHSPYARPQAKKSSWNILGFLNYLNPLRSRSPTESVSESSSSSDIDEEPSSPQISFAAESLSNRGRQIAHDINMHGRSNAPQNLSSEQHLLTTHSQQPPQASTNLLHSSAAPLHNAGPSSPVASSPAKNLEAVSAFLSERAGKPISEIEMEGLLHLIEKSTPPEESETFRFSSRTPTPARGNSPFLANTSGINFGFGSSIAQSSTPSPRKTLDKNPNGVYRWEGGGSAKASRSRNRYSSPAFGPSRLNSNRLILKESQTVTDPPKSDTKRRRVDDETPNSAAISSGPNITAPNGGIMQTNSARGTTPDPPSTRTKQTLPFPASNDSSSIPVTPNGVSSPKPNGTPNTSRLRVPPISQKHTAPAVPSPLRQAWSGTSSPTHTGTSQTPPQQKQTKAANFMTELIKEVTPPKRPDLSNPYQTASPVNKVGGLPKARAGKRVRATGKPTIPITKDEKNKEKEKTVSDKEEKGKDYSPQAIIEATLPKGSKRSRPPAHFDKMAITSNREVSPPMNTSPSPDKTVDQCSGAHKSSMAYIVEEIDDEDDETKHCAKKSKVHVAEQGFTSANGRKSPVPPLSQDIIIEEVSDTDLQNPPEKLRSATPPPNTFSQLTANGGPTNSSIMKSNTSSFKSTSVPKEPSKLRYSYQPEAGGPAITPTPESTLISAPAPGYDSQDKKSEVEEPKAKLPTAKEVALAIPVHSLPTFVFSVSTKFPYPSTLHHTKACKEAKLLPITSLPSFEFNICALKSEPVSKPPIASPIKAFDWAAAGMKPTVVSNDTGASWICSTCMLSNPATAVDKCTICDSPR